MMLQGVRGADDDSGVVWRGGDMTESELVVVRFVAWEEEKRSIEKELGGIKNGPV